MNINCFGWRFCSTKFWKVKEQTEEKLMHQIELMYIFVLLCIISALFFHELHMAAKYHKLPLSKMAVF